MTRNMASLPTSNTDTSNTEQEGFIFGQNMADRVVQPNEDVEKTNGTSGSKDGDNGAASSEDHPSSSPIRLRPSAAFRSPNAGGILTPSRLGSYPFSPSHSNTSAISSEGSNVLIQPRLANNPFAVKPSSRGSSDSEDEKGSKPIVAPASFKASNNFGSPRKGVFDNQQNNAGATARFMLRPSALDKQTENFKKSVETTDSTYKTSFKLEPAKLQNPFLKTVPDEKEVTSPVKNDPTGGGTSEGSEKKEDKVAKCESGASSEPAREQSQDNSGPSFIFGQNLHERVVPVANKANKLTKEESVSQDSEAAGNSSLVFGENITNKVVKPPEPAEEKESISLPPVTGDQTSPHKTLEESAAAHQAKQAKPELQKVDVVTGEENESNVLQINVKLFAFEKDTQNWVERGRGLLRLNDMSTGDAQAFQSRLVMRTQGSLRVVLNTKLWSGMMVERASPKTVRFSATEDDVIRIFLIMASSKDADQMYSAIDRRVQQLKMQESQKDDGGTSAQETTDASLPDTPLLPSHGQKRHKDDASEESPVTVKKPRFDPEKRRDIVQEESNDSSTLDPETEASNESFSSTNKSSSSE